LKSEDGSGFEVPLELKLKGDQVVGTGSDGVTVRGGSFTNGALRLELFYRGKAYTFTAVFRDGKLTGDWNSDDNSMKGAWSGTRNDPTRFGDGSPAVVPLYEYHTLKGGDRLYSTNPKPPDKAWERAPEPICQVWKNPMSVLALDTEPTPVPLANH
jgi:hypothetical protein